MKVLVDAKPHIDGFINPKKASELLDRRVIEVSFENAREEWKQV
jgi:hypothetical protein